MDEPHQAADSDLEGMLEKIVRRQDRADARNSAHQDRLLKVLANIGTAGTGIALSLVVDGCMIIGVCGPSGAFAAEVGRAARTAMEAGGIDSTAATELQEMFTSFEDPLIEEGEKFRSVVKKYDDDVTIDDLDAADLRDFYRAFAERTTIDLREVTFYGAGSTAPISISSMRVRVDSISAWWPTEAQEGAAVNYLPGPTA